MIGRGTERRKRREQSKAKGENPCAQAMENPTLESGILLAEKMQRKSNSMAIFNLA